MDRAEKLPPAPHDIPVSIWEHVYPLVRSAQQHAENGNELAPYAFVFGADEQLQAVHLDSSSAAANAASSASVRQLAGQVDATFVLSIIEAWSIPQEFMAQSAELLAQYGSVSNCPCRETVLFVLLETHDGCWSTTSPITEHAGGKRNVATLDLSPVSAEGRMTNLLPTKRPRPTMH